MINEPAESDGGRGGILFARPDNIRSDARMVSRLLGCGCIEPDEIDDLLRQAVPLAKAAAGSGKAREYAATMGVLVSAAKLGQEQQKLERPREAARTTVNVAVGVQVVESDDWYGTKASNAQFAESDGPPANGAAIPGTVQGGSLRAAVGQNGVGTNGHSKGPRTDEGPSTGSH